MEFPKAVYTAMADELADARAAASSLISIQSVEAEARHRQALLTMRAAAGALWAFHSSRARHKGDKKLPLLPAGMTPLDSEETNRLELPGLRRKRATLLALIASASAHAVAAERTALQTHAIGAGSVRPVYAAFSSGRFDVGGGSVDDKPDTPSRGSSPGPRPGSAQAGASASAAGRSPAGSAGGISYANSAEACSKMRLFHPIKSSPMSNDNDNERATEAVAAFLAAVQAHADSKHNDQARSKRMPHPLRRPPSEISGTSSCARFFSQLKRAVALWPSEAHSCLPAELITLPDTTATPGALRARAESMPSGDSPPSLRGPPHKGGRGGGDVAAARADALKNAAAKVDALLHVSPDRLADVITEQRIRRFATSIGYDLQTGKSQFSQVQGAIHHVLPTVLMCLSAPLPPGWTCKMLQKSPAEENMPKRSSKRASREQPTGEDAVAQAVGAETLSSLDAELADEEDEEEAGVDGEIFEHVLSGVTLMHHPLLPTFSRLIKGELKRFSGSRYSTLTCHEWIRVAEPGPATIIRGGTSKIFGRHHDAALSPSGKRHSLPTAGRPGAASPLKGGGKLGGGKMELHPIWINLQTGQRCDEFPRLSGPEDAVFRRSNGWAAHKAAFKDFYELTTLRQSIGDLPEKHVMRRRWRAARGRALSRRPLTMLEVIYAAEVMGIDPFKEPDLMFLAESALCLELPLGWERVEMIDAATFYRNTLLRQKQWQHPQLTYLVALAKHWRAAEAEARQQALAAAAE